LRHSWSVLIYFSEVLFKGQPDDNSSEENHTTAEHKSTPELIYPVIQGTIYICHMENLLKTVDIKEVQIYRLIFTRSLDTVAPLILRIPEISAERHFRLAATTCAQDSGSTLEETSENSYTEPQICDAGFVSCIDTGYMLSYLAKLLNYRHY
jgi:hypothetical protein